MRARFESSGSPAPIRQALDRIDRPRHAVRDAQTSIQGMIALWGQARGWWHTNHAYAVVVHSGDALYQDVHTWLINATAPDRQRSLVVRTVRTHDGDRAVPVSEDEPPPPEQMVFVSDDRREVKVELDGHRITVSLQKPQLDGDIFRIVDRDDAWLKPSIHFTARNIAGREAVVRHLSRLLAARQRERRPVLRLLSKWGGWQVRADLPVRPLESVILKAGQRERLVGDIAAFLYAEDEYARHGFPYHRGYLLHGPPGTGKTSVVRGLSTHFGMDLWYVPLGDIDKDANLLALLSGIHPRSILLLEDIDVFRSTKTRQADGDEPGSVGGVSLSGLLNALDGVATPHGLITFMTTNDRRQLDPALTRPGRVDLEEEIGLPDFDQTWRLIQRFYGPVPMGVELVDAAREYLTERHPLSASPAAVLEACKRHPNNPMLAIRTMAEGSSESMT